METKTLSKEQLYRIGSFDKGGRYTLKPEFETNTSEKIRTPSRRWNLSVWKHCQTAKYYNALVDKIGLDAVNNI